MRVATYNIKNGLDLDANRTDNAKLVEACRQLDADILALQEVDRRRVRSRFRRQSRLVARRTGGKETFGRTRRRDLIGAYGNALIVKGALSDVEQSCTSRSATTAPSSRSCAPEISLRHPVRPRSGSGSAAGR